MIFWIVYIILFVVVGIFAPFKVYGKKNINKKQNYIIICNHKSNFDAILLDLVFGKKNIYLAKIELFKNKLSGFFLKKLGGIGFDRIKGLSLTQTKIVRNLINKKENIGIFPEGTRKNDLYENDAVKGGACFFAIKTKTPLIPCFIAKKHKFFRKNTIIVGKPFELTEFYDKNLNKDALIKAENILKCNILELKNEYENFLNEKKILKKLVKERSKK